MKTYISKGEGVTERAYWKKVRQDKVYGIQIRDLRSE
jgi:hypothetical protein